MSTAPSWNITIKDSSGVTVKTYSGSSTTIDNTWDGQDSLGNIVPSGNYTATATASGCSDTKTANITISCGSIVDITELSSSKSVISATSNGTVDITSTISCDADANWILTSNNSVGDTVFSYEGTGNSLSYTWDCIGALPGIYTVYLEAYTEFGGNRCSTDTASITIEISDDPDPNGGGGNDKSCSDPNQFEGNPINVTNGNKYQDETDFDYSMPGSDLRFVRYYNSVLGNVVKDDNGAGHYGAFGSYKWSHNYDLVITNPASDRVLVRLFDGEFLYFSKETDGSYSPITNPNLSLAKDSTGFDLVRKDGTKFRFDLTGKLTSITDENGNVTTIATNGSTTIVTDAFGRTITIAYENDRIVTVTDPYGKVYRYGYETATDGVTHLKGVTYPDDTPLDENDNPHVGYGYDEPRFLHNLTTRTDESGHIKTWGYDSNGMANHYDNAGFESITLDYSTHGQASVLSSEGHEKLYTYHKDTSGKNLIDTLVGCTSCNGSNSYVYYPGTQNIQSATDNNGNITEYTGYDSKGNPATITVKDSLGNVLRTTHYTYDSATSAPVSIRRESVMKTTENPDTETLNVYDPSTHLLTKTYVKGNAKTVDGHVEFHNYSSSYQYNSKGLATAQTDQLGNRTVFGYYSSVTWNADKWRLASVTKTLDGRPYTSTYGDYSSGKVGWMVDASGVRTEYTYDARGRIIGVASHVDADHPRNATYTYDDYGNIESATTADGRTAYYTHDAANRLWMVTDADGGYVEYGYDTEGNRVSERVFDGLSQTTLREFVNVYDYANDGRLSKLTDPAGNVVYREFKTYDGNGNVLEVADNNGKSTNYVYDKLDRLEHVYLPPAADGTADRIAETYEYNAGADRVSSTDGELNATKMVYDDFGRVAEATDAENRTIRYQYDAAGNMTDLVDANGKATHFSYYEGGQLKRKTYDDGTHVDYTYYPGGLRKTKKNARGSTATYTYYPGTDDLKSVAYSALATPSVTYTYDDTYDRVTGITMSDELTYAYTYDGNARVKTVDGPWDADTLTYTRDYLGRVQRIDQQGGNPIEYEYDTLGRLDKVRDMDPAGTREFDYAYAGLNGTNMAPDTLTRPSGGTTKYTYDNLFRLTNIENRKSGGTLINSFGYTYNKAHMRMIETVDGGVAFDLIGGEGEKAFTYNGVNQLLTETGRATACTYDLDGNMTGGYTPDGTRFSATYDAENRLTKMAYPADAPTSTAYFYYGPDGFLVKQKVNGTWTRFVNSGGLALQDRGGNNTVTRTYVWDGVSPGGIGGLLEMNYDTQHYNYLYDGKGNVVTVLNNVQGKAAEYRYDSFGSLVAQSGTLNQAYRFSTKRYYQGYGVSYFGYRFYVAHLGRWMTYDPIGERGGVNLYRAMKNNIVNSTDTFGLYETEEEAAKVALWWSTMFSTDYEYGGFIYDACGGKNANPGAIPDFQFTRPKTSYDPINWQIPIDEEVDRLNDEGKLTTTYHTHLESGIPSDSDYRAVGPAPGWNFGHGFIGVISTSEFIKYYANHTKEIIGHYK